MGKARVDGGVEKLTSTKATQIRTMNRVAFVLLLATLWRTTDALRCCTGTYEVQQVVGQTNLCAKSDVNMCVNNSMLMR